jgi:uncharacterized membrane protein YdfJ with MMPL/SSD domain
MVPLRHSYEELTAEFPGGVLTPVNVLIGGEDLDERDEELLRLQNGLQGEFLDAFEIRTLLVPALVLFVGPRGFWPAKVRP